MISNALYSLVFILATERATSSSLCICHLIDVFKLFSQIIRKTGAERNREQKKICLYVYEYTCVCMCVTEVAEKSETIKDSYITVNR